MHQTNYCWYAVRGGTLTSTQIQKCTPTRTHTERAFPLQLDENCYAIPFTVETDK